MIKGFHHAQITIPKGMEAEARHFYCEVMQLIEIVKPESLAGRGGLWVQVGDQQLHIGTEDEVDRTLTKAHVAYEVEAIKKIVNKQKYKMDMYWSGILFGIMVWTIAMCSLLPNL